MNAFTSFITLPGRLPDLRVFDGTTKLTHPGYIWEPTSAALSIWPACRRSPSSHGVRPSLLLLPFQRSSLRCSRSPDARIEDSWISGRVGLGSRIALLSAPSLHPSKSPVRNCHDTLVRRRRHIDRIARASSLRKDDRWPSGLGSRSCRSGEVFLFLQPRRVNVN